MSITIIKSGVLDTIQDLGRYGYQHLGINPGGAMDRVAAQLSNLLVGNEPGAPVLELHFPAAALTFNAPSLVAITGADFNPQANGQLIPLNHPILLNKNVELKFTRKNSGARCYVAIKGLKTLTWLNSYGTNLKAGAGGHQGRALKKSDSIEADAGLSFEKYLSGDIEVLPWKVDPGIPYDSKDLGILAGHEWERLDKKNQSAFLSNEFSITKSADRMGYQLEGPPIFSSITTELVSSGVNFGTIQLLPSGKLIILMADHQTTGGYPRVAHVLSAHLPVLAQKQPGDSVRFISVENENAEDLLWDQQQHLHQLQNACKFRLEQFFS